MKKKLLLLTVLWGMMLSLSGCSSNIGSTLSKAALNTLMGMGTVFVVLIFIAFLISRFKYIANFEKWLQNRRAKKEMPAVSGAAELSSAIAEDEEVSDETDDLELVAVITAALAASLNTSADKLIVRSIRRRNSNRW